jgi:hypothetical protein
MNSETIAQLGELLDLKLDQKIDKLETRLFERVTEAVAESEKVAQNVDKKIESMLAPISQRQDDLEVKSDTKFDDIQKQITDLGDLVRSQSVQRSLQGFPALPVRETFSAAVSNSYPEREQVTNLTNDDQNPKNPAIVNIVSHAKCIVGIAPVTPAHVEKQCIATDYDPHMKAVIEYLRRA